MPRRNQEPFDEYPLRPDAALPAPAHRPGRDPHLGKPASRYIAERIVGKIDDDESGEVFIQLKGGRKMSLQRVLQKLSSHVGFSLELTLYEDGDPDVGMRIAEGLEGAEPDQYGSITWRGPSVYVWRLNHELQNAFPDRRYVAFRDNETLCVTLHGEGRPQQRFNLSSPQLGLWSLEVREGRKWVVIGVKLSFVEAIEQMIALEQRE